jgi:hypothetical protein
VGSLLPIVFFAIAGILLGGVVSLRRQGAGPAAVVTTGVLALLATGAGVLWLLPGD